MSAQVRIHGGPAFACPPGVGLVHAALSAGIELPHSCLKGACGSCAGRVLAGHLQALPGAALRNGLCEDGQVLLCRATVGPDAGAGADVEIAPASWRRIDAPVQQTLQAKVYRVQQACSDVTVLHLRLPAGVRAKFRAGQYLQVRLADGSRRAYSMANPPHENDSLLLHVRQIPEGRFSQQAAALRPGDVLTVDLPHGSFTLRDEDTRPVVFVAGGTGFAPIKAMLDDLLKRGPRRTATLLWAVRRREHLYAGAAVQRWQRLLPGFRVLAAISDEAVPEEQPEEMPTVSGLAHEALPRLCPSLADHALYACGAPPMVAAVRQAAQGLGLAAADFHADLFVPTANP